MDFSKSVKKALIDKEANTAWLAEEVSKSTGLFCDTAYISRILSGQRNAPKIKAAISEILGINGE